MINLKDLKKIGYFIGYFLIALSAACSSSNNNNDTVEFDPAMAPQNVQVVSGDGDSSAVQNTISWTRDPLNPDYVIYVSNTPGVTENSSKVVPTATGFTYATHSGDVIAGNTYYYRVQASLNGESSVLSEEVSGTPQLSITSNALNDVAWNGVDTLVAVGDSGVILHSANGMADAWDDDLTSGTNQSLTAVIWESVNSQFLIVGAGSSVLIGDGSTGWSSIDLEVSPAANLEDVAWLGDRYIAVGKNGIIITSNGEGTVWTKLAVLTGLDPAVDVSAITLKGVAGDGNNLIVVVGTNGTILTSTNDGVNWQAATSNVNNDLNDISWDGSQFGVVGSNDTILTSPDGLSWTKHNPGTSDITFIAATQLVSSSLANPVLSAVGSSGTFVVSPDAVTGYAIPTGTNQQLSGITWVDNVSPPYFVMVGNDGTVLNSLLQ